MALVPCNVCGTLNSDEAEICLSCEYPIKGRRRPAIFQWVAVGLFVLFTIPVINVALSFIRNNSQQKKSYNHLPAQVQETELRLHAVKL